MQQPQQTQSRQSHLSLPQHEQQQDSQVQLALPHFGAALGFVVPPQPTRSRADRASETSKVFITASEGLAQPQQLAELSMLISGHAHADRAFDWQMSHAAGQVAQAE